MSFSLCPTNWSMNNVCYALTANCYGVCFFFFLKAFFFKWTFIFTQVFSIWIVFPCLCWTFSSPFVIMHSILLMVSSFVAYHFILFPFSLLFMLNNVFFLCLYEKRVYETSFMWKWNPQINYLHPSLISSSLSKCGGK